MPSGCSGSVTVAAPSSTGTSARTWPGGCLARAPTRDGVARSPGQLQPQPHGVGEPHPRRLTRGLMASSATGSRTFSARVASTVRYSRASRSLSGPANRTRRRRQRGTDAARRRPRRGAVGSGARRGTGCGPARPRCRARADARTRRWPGRAPHSPGRTGRPHRRRRPSPRSTPWHATYPGTGHSTPDSRCRRVSSSDPWSAGSRRAVGGRGVAGPARRHRAGASAPAFRHRPGCPASRRARRADWPVAPATGGPLHELGRGPQRDPPVPPGGVTPSSATRRGHRLLASSRVRNLLVSPSRNACSRSRFSTGTDASRDVGTCSATYRWTAPTNAARSSSLIA